jgi:hypothetical protein
VRLRIEFLNEKDSDGLIAIATEGRAAAKLRWPIAHRALSFSAERRRGPHVQRPATFRHAQKGHADPEDLIDDLQTFLSQGTSRAGRKSGKR